MLNKTINNITCVDVYDILKRLLELWKLFSKFFLEQINKLEN